MRKTYSALREETLRRYPDGFTPGGVSVDDIVQLKLQNTYDTHLDIARDMASVMRADMAAYDADPSKFTQSLGCWSGFHAQQMIKAVKRLRGTARGTYVYLSGWMVAGLRNRWGHLPDQSMHEKTAVADLIEEIYVSLRQADEVALNDLFAKLKAARKAGDAAAERAAIAEIDGFESHVVPIIADIDAGFGNEHATYLLARELIKAGASALQIENQVSDAKQCGHQDGKVTVPREDFIEKLRACRLAFEELGVDDGVIVARTDSLGAGLTQKVPVSQRPGDLASEYIKWLKTEPITPANPMEEGELALWQDGGFVKPVRMPNGLFAFREGTGPRPGHRGLHRLAERGRRRPGLDRDRHAERRRDRLDGRRDPRGGAEGEAHLQQLAVVQLDAQPAQAGPRPVARGRPHRRGRLPGRPGADVGRPRRQRARA